jgi:hypothetical protein
MLPCNGQRLWLIVGCMTIMSPLLTTMFSGWLGSIETDNRDADGSYHPLQVCFLLLPQTGAAWLLALRGIG